VGLQIPEEIVRGATKKWESLIAAIPSMTFVTPSKTSIVPAKMSHP